MNIWSVFALGLVARLWFIHAYPIVFGGDSILRLMNRDHVLLAYQLPLLQALLHGLWLADDGLLAARILMALIGAFAGAAFFHLTSHLVDTRSAWVASLLFTLNPFLIQLSIVPYQEVLMVALLVLAFSLFFRGHDLAASICLGAACLTRYEAWAACPALGLYLLYRGKPTVQSFLLVAWAPIAWIVWHHGISSAGTFVIEIPETWRRLMRFVYLSWIVVKNTAFPVLILAAIAAWTAVRRRLPIRRDHAIALGGFLLLFLLSIPFSAHGESPDPEAFITARTATTLIAAVTFLAAHGIRRFNRMGLILSALAIPVSLFMTDRFLARDTAAPNLQLSYLTARYLDATIPATGKAAILVKPIPQQLLDQYLNKVSRRGGEPALVRARQMMAGLDITPPDYQRIVVHSHLGKDRLLPTAEPGDVEWVVIWSDSPPDETSSAALRERVRSTGILEKTITAGTLEAKVYRLR